MQIFCTGTFLFRIIRRSQGLLYKHLLNLYFKSVCAQVHRCTGFGRSKCQTTSNCIIGSKAMAFFLTGWISVAKSKFYFCLHFLYHLNMLFLFIEKSRIPLIDNSRTWQHRERYILIRAQSLQDSTKKKTVIVFPDGFVIDVKKKIFQKEKEKNKNGFSSIFFLIVFRCLTHFKIGTHIVWKTTV